MHISKGLQIDLACSLLIQEYCNAELSIAVAAVVFLIVDGSVLDKDVHSDGKLRPALKRSDVTANKGIFRIILAVTAGECSAVHIDSRCIPAVTQIVGFTPMFSP